MPRKFQSQPKKQPEHDVIYQALKDMILFGDFIPGQPLTIMNLAETLGASATPIREAIRRLTAERALETQENRRVAVPHMTSALLEELDFLRLTIEPELARRAAPHVTPAEIDALERHDDELEHAINIGDVKLYMKANYAFHFTLYQRAEAPTLLKVAESIWLQIGPALRVGCGRFGTAKLTDQHMETTKALRNGKFDRVSTSIREDIIQGMDFVRHSLK